MRDAGGAPSPPGPRASVGSSGKRASRPAEPFQAGGGGVQPLSGSERGAWRGVRLQEPAGLSRPPARRPVAAACWPRRGLAPDPDGLGKGSKRPRCGGPARGERAPGAAGGGQGLDGCDPTTSSQAWPDSAILPFSLPPAPCPLPAHLAAGRGAPREGQQGTPWRLSRMLRDREPCRCHGRSSVCWCPPLRQPFKQAWGRGPAQPRPCSLSFSFSAVAPGALNSHLGAPGLGPSRGKPSVPASPRTCRSVPPPRGSVPSQGFLSSFPTPPWDPVPSLLPLVPSVPGSCSRALVKCTGADTPPSLQVSARLPRVLHFPRADPARKLPKVFP